MIHPFENGIGPCEDQIRIVRFSGVSLAGDGENRDRQEFRGYGH